MRQPELIQAVTTRAAEALTKKLIIDSYLAGAHALMTAAKDENKGKVN